MQGWRARASLVVHAAAVAATAVWTAGCGGSSGGGSSTPGPQVSGRVVAGPVVGATVRVFRVQPDRSLVLVAEGTTDASGAYTLTPPGDGPFLILAGGGSYKDEATGQTITLASPPSPATLDSPRPGALEALIGAGAGTDPIPVSITPLSTIASRRSVELSASDPTALSESAVEEAATTVAIEMGLGSLDPRSVSPVDLTDPASAGVNPSSPEARVGALLAGLSRAALDAGVNDPMDLVDALAADFSDGSFNGLQGTTPVPLDGGTLPPSAGTADLAQATQGFLDDPTVNQSGTSSTSFQALLDDVATQDVAPPGVNKAPTLDAIADRTATAGDPPLAITLTGVGAGVGENQTVTVAATSGDPGLATVALSGSGSTRTLSVTPLSPGTVTITVTVSDDGGTANGGVDTLTRRFDVAIAAPTTSAPAITSAAPPATAVEGFAYSHTVTTTGNPAPTLAAVGLPGWLTLTGDTLQGTPGAADVGVVSSITLTADNGIGAPATQQFTVSVLAAAPPTITSTPGLTATQGAAYSYTVIASGTPLPTVSASGLPGWLTLTGNALSGTPAAGDVGVVTTITLTASNGVTPDDVQVFAIDVQGPATITSTPVTAAIAGQAYSYTVTATGNPAPTLSASGLPGWLSLSGATLSGTPAVGDAGPVSITITADNGVGAPDDQTFTLEVRTAPAITSGAPPSTATAGAAYSHTVTTTGYPAPTLSLAGAPAWLTLTGSTLSGTPGLADVAVISTVTITADNGVSPAATQTFTVEVLGAPTITSTPPTTAAVGTPYAYTITVSGNPTPTVQVSNLPAWLTFSGGTIQGTPGAGDQGTTATIEVRALANGVGPDDVQTFQIDVSPQFPAGTWDGSAWDNATWGN